MSDARTRVVSSVTQALGDIQGRGRVEPPIIAVAEGGEDRRDLARRFSAELALLSGSAILVRDRAECAAALAAYLQDREVRTVAVQSRPLAADIASRLHGVAVSVACDRDKLELARVDCGLLEACSLVADTGSAIVVLENSADRVLPYLPRTCAIVADISSLHAMLGQQAMRCIEEAAANGVRGEALIVAGPSRSADIEKTLVLGAHGPQAVAVFIIEHP